MIDIKQTLPPFTNSLPKISLLGVSHIRDTNPRRLTWSNDSFLFFSSVLSPRRYCSHKIPAPTILNPRTSVAPGKFHGRAAMAQDKPQYNFNRPVPTSLAHFRIHAALRS